MAPSYIFIAGFGAGIASVLIAAVLLFVFWMYSLGNS